MTDLSERPALSGRDRAALREPPPREQWSPTEPSEFVPFRVLDRTEPARRWWQRKPSAEELTYRQHCDEIRNTHWSAARRAVVANPKSSAKTPTSVILTGMLAENRAGDVVAWDASESAGSLRARTGGTQRHCVSDVAGGTDRYDTRAGLSAAVAVQTSNAHIMGSLVERNLTPDHVTTVTDKLDPYYAIQLADTGANAVHSPTFQRALSLADVVVVPTVLTADSLNKAAEFVHGLLAPTADGPSKWRGKVLVIVSDYGTQVTAQQARDTLTRAGAALIVQVPFDPHIAEGGAIDTHRLTQASRFAWTAAAAQLVTLLGKAT